jgi:hypothetical protein
MRCSILFQIHWSNPQPDCSPNTCEQILLDGIDPEFIISRRQTGEPLSRFKDDVWDCRLYGAVGTFVFNSWWDAKANGEMDALARAITDEIKTIHWLSQFETTCNTSRSRGYSNLKAVLLPLRAFAKLAHQLGIKLMQAANSSAFQVALRCSISNLDKGFKTYSVFQGMLSDLAYWQTMKNIDCDVPRIVPETDLSTVQALLKKLEQTQRLDSYEQTPLIPTRLFAKLIGGALEQLKTVEPYLPHMEAYIRALYSNPIMAVENPSDYWNALQRCRRSNPDLSSRKWEEVKIECLSKNDTIARFGLTEYFDLQALRTLRNLENHIGHLRCLCVILIHAFTGMRASEVHVMPYEPVVHQAVKGFGDVPVLVSHLKKFELANYSRAMVWATSNEGIYAVRIAQQLARCNWFRNYPSKAVMPDNLPLWIPSLTSRENPHAHYDVLIANVHFSERWGSVTKSLGLVIEQADIDELTTFDAFRAWDEAPEFAIGKLWPLASHQFRRSTAVYASRSGMVSLPTLKTQFKQISAVMTALYSENSSYAASFLIDENGRPIDNKSVLMSFREALSFNTSIRFHEQVIESKSHLYGPRGTEIQRAKDKGHLPQIFESRKATEKAVKEGRFDYKETPVGGCTLKGSCPHFGVDIVLPCTSGCKDALLKKEKLKTYVDSLKFDQGALSPNSRPYKEIVAEIQHVTNTYLTPLVKNS